MTSKIFTTADPVLMSKWRILWSKSPAANYINSPDWFLAALEVFKYQKLKLITIWQSNQLVAVAPLVSERRHGVQIYTNPGMFVCGLPFLIDLGNASAVTILRRELLAIGRVFLDEVPESLVTCISDSLPQADSYFSTKNFFLDQSSGLTDPRVKKHMAKIKRKIPGFDRDFDLDTFDSHHDDKLNTVFQLDDQSSKHDRGYSTFSDPQVKLFFTNLSKRFKGQLVIRCLNYQGQAIAYEIGFIINHTYFGNQIAHNRDFAHLSPGKVILIKIQEQLLAEKITRIDFGAGDNHFKRTFSTGFIGLYKLLVFQNQALGLYLKSIDFAKNRIYDLLKSHTKIYTLYRHLTHFRPTFKKVSLPQIAQPKLGILGKIIPAVFCLMVLLVSLRGQIGTPDMSQLNTRGWKEDGPFELSPERGRFGLVYSLVEDKSVYFSVPVGRFITPDLGIWNGKYVSLFAPGISFITAPGYLVGRAFGATQVGAYAVISVFAVLNFLLIRRISRQLGASDTASILAGLLFVFATPAYAYAVNLYQHHVSTFLILASIALVMRERIRWWSFFTIWFLCALSLLVDYPNLFIMAPIGLVALFRVISVKLISEEKVRVSTSFRLLLTFVGVILPILVFAAFNYYSYGSPTRLSGTVPLVSELDAEGLPVAARNSAIKQVEDLDYSKVEAQTTLNFFNPRNFVNGLYILILSLDRGLFIYAPVVLFGIFGAIRLYQLKQPYLPLLIATGSMDLLLYAMWGDPWGGWAFGSRYLIPGFAIMSIFLAVFLTVYRRYLPLLLLFLITAIYSLGVNALGAITTSALPPKVQVLELEQITGTVQRYTWRRNWDMLSNGHSKSFFYNQYIKGRMTPKNFYYCLSGILTLAVIYLLVRSYREKYATEPFVREN